MRRNKASEVSYKILNGDMLTLEEFKLSINKGYFESTNPPKNDGDWAKAYLVLCGQHYNSPKRRGWICGQHPKRHISENEFCAWGIHLDEIEPQYLTRENRRYLKRKFGTKTVNEILK